MKRPLNVRRSDEQLRTFAEQHLSYEFDMLSATAEALSSGASETHLRNALLESFAIHLRALMNFLWGAAVHADDAVALHYFATPDDWQRVRPPFPSVLNAARDRAGKEIEHLTYARPPIPGPGRQWQYAAMADAIGPALATFAANALPARLGNALSDLRGTTRARSA